MVCSALNQKLDLVFTLTAYHGKPHNSINWSAAFVAQQRLQQQQQQKKNVSTKKVIANGQVNTEYRITMALGRQ